MSFRKGRKLEKIEEILDKEPKKDIEKKENIEIEEDDQLVTNLKKLNSNLILKIEDYQINIKKINKENRKLVGKNKILNDLIEKIKLENEEKIEKIKLKNEEKKNEENEKNKQKIIELNELQKTEIKYICEREQKKRKKVVDQQKKK